MALAIKQLWYYCTIQRAQGVEWPAPVAIVYPCALRVLKAFTLWPGQSYPGRRRPRLHASIRELKWVDCTAVNLCWQSYWFNLISVVLNEPDARHCVIFLELKLLTSCWSFEWGYVSIAHLTHCKPDGGASVNLRAWTWMLGHISSRWTSRQWATVGWILQQCNFTE